MTLEHFETALSVLTIPEGLFALVILLSASLIRGLTGFGFSAILVTGISCVITPAQTVVMALLLEIVASLHLLPGSWRNIDWRLLSALSIGIVIGTPVGVSLLTWLDPTVMRLLISSTVLIFAMLILRGFAYTGPRTLPVHSGVGLVCGVCNGTAALGGMPMVTFLLSTDVPVIATRATLIAAFFATDVYALMFAGGHGLIETNVIAYALMALPVMVIGVAVGQRMFRIAPPELFKKVALILLLLLSTTGILRSVTQLL